MCFKKNAFSYFCWGLMILLVGAIAAYWGMVASQLFANGNILLAIGGCALFFALVFAIYLLIGVLLKYTTVLNTQHINNNISVIEELIIVSLLMVAFYTVRTYLLPILTVDTAYFNVAQITEGGNISTRFVQGSTYYYCMLLHFCFKVFGNHLIVGVWLQMILQAICSLLFYLAIRKLGGKVTAILFLIIVSFSSTTIDAGMTYSPQMLYLSLFGLVFYLCTLYLGKIGSALNTVKMWVCTVCLGMCIGFVCYVDVTGVLLLLLMSCICMVHCDRYWTRHRYLHMGALFGSAILMFLLMIFLDACICGSKFSAVLNAWFAVYSDLSVNIGEIAKNYSREFIVLPILIALGIYAFFRRKEEQCYAPFILLVVGMTVLYFTGVPGQNMDGNYLLYLLMTALAGVSVSELFYAPATDMVPNNETVEERQEKEEVELPKGEAVSATVKTAEKEKETTDMEKRVERKPEENNKIENPLPIPKKKEKKVMDYAYQPKPFEMMFDIRVSDKDDFDI